MSDEIWILLGLIAIAAVAGLAVFRKKIREIRAVMTYAGIFKPAVIDENFRSLYKKYPAIKIAKGGAVRELLPTENPVSLPLEYPFEGNTHSAKDLLDKVHYTGLVIMKGECILYEDYRRGNDKDTHAILMSVSKSVASILIGKAFEDGDIESLNDPIIKYVPSLSGSAYDGVSVQQVLDMSSGIRWNEDYGDLKSDIVRSVVAMLTGSLDAFAKTLEREFEPGTFNRYASIDTQVLAMVLRGATGRTYQDYLQNELWQKIGAEHDAYILTDTVGEPVALGGLNVTLRDLARFGLLVLEGGKTQNGERIVSPQWLKQSTAPDAPHLMPGKNNPNSDHDFGYKHQWWIPVEPDNGDFVAIGIFGQFLYINPLRSIIIAVNSAYPEYNEDEEMEYRVVAMLQEFARELSPVP